LIENLKQLLADQIPLLERALIVLRQKSKAEIQPHLDHLTQLFLQRQRSVEQHCGKQTQKLRLSLFIPSADFSSTASLQRSRTSSNNSNTTIFRPTTTSSPQKTPIELREELTSVRPRRPQRTVPSSSSSVSSLAGASNDSPRSSTADISASGQSFVASASQTLSFNEDFVQNPISPTKRRALTRSSEQLLIETNGVPPAKPPKFLH